MWLLIIHREPKTFTNNEGKEIEYYDVGLRYINNPKIVDSIITKALASKNIEQFDEDEI